MKAFILITRNVKKHMPPPLAPVVGIGFRLRKVINGYMEPVIKGFLLYM